MGIWARFRWASSGEYSMATLNLANKPCVCSRERERELVGCLPFVIVVRERFVCLLYRLVKVTWPIFIGISVRERERTSGACTVAFRQTEKMTFFFFSFFWWQGNVVFFGSCCQRLSGTRANLCSHRLIFFLIWYKQVILKPELGNHKNIFFPT